MLSKDKQPKTKIINIVDEIHGLKINDPYRWLEEAGRDTGKWIKEQNIYTRSLLDQIPVKHKLRQKLEKLYRIDTIGIPYPKGDRYFFMERKGSEDLSVLYVQKNLTSKPRVLIDQNKLSKDKTTTLKSWSPSWDGKLLAYSLSMAGNDQASIYIMDVDTGKNLIDVIPGEVYPGLNVTWKPDKSGFWYTHRHPKAPKGEEKFHQKLYFHKLGNDFKDDPLFYGEDLAKEDVPSVQISKNGNYLLVSVYFASTKKRKVEIYFKDLTDLDSKFIPVVKNIYSLFYSSIYKDTIFIMTNYKSPQWRIVSLNIKDVKKGVKGWKTVIPEDKKYIVSSYKVIRGYLFLEVMENVHSLLKIYSLNGKFIKEIPLPDIGSLGGMTGEQDGEELFFSFSSYLTPNTIYRYDLNGKKVARFKKTKLDFNDSLYKVDQIWYSSQDGTKVPMFVVHKKDIKLDGQNPTLVYGYGGFNIGTTPVFDRNIIPFLEDGGVYVETILRGGSEFGEEWHKAGMKNKKQNVFDDFIGASEWLIKNKFTNPDKLAIFGWSNGGLLVGATITQRPELFKVAIIGAPVIDMLRYHLFHGGRHWIQEYGSAESKSDLKYLLKYSPYHNVKKENYPAVLMLTANKDDRVDPMHAFKFVAKLQEDNESTSPILIRIEVQAGHSGAASVNRAVEQYSDLWSFVYWQLGISSEDKNSLKS